MMAAALEKSVASEASEESEDFEASDAYEESVRKSRETTELLTVCLCIDKPTNRALGLGVGPTGKGQPVWPLQVVREAKGCQGHQLETVRCQSHGVRKPWEVMSWHQLQRHKLHQQACKS